MWIERRLSSQVLAAARQFPALVVTGGRQTGKTTLLRHLFPEASFASLDLPSAAFQADERGEEFLRSHKEPVILDEVQYSPGLFRYLKVAIDARREGQGRFLMTGSIPPNPEGLRLPLSVSTSGPQPGPDLGFRDLRHGLRPCSPAGRRRR